MRCKASPILAPHLIKYLVASIAIIEASVRVLVSYRIPARILLASWGSGISVEVSSSINVHNSVVEDASGYTMPGYLGSSPLDI
jgi:hypothetical protein